MVSIGFYSACVLLPASVWSRFYRIPCAFQTVPAPTLCVQLLTVQTNRKYFFLRYLNWISAFGENKLIRRLKWMCKMSIFIVKLQAPVNTLIHFTLLLSGWKRGPPHFLSCNRTTAYSCSWTKSLSYVLDQISVTCSSSPTTGNKPQSDPLTGSSHLL